MGRHGAGGGPGAIEEVKIHEEGVKLVRSDLDLLICVCGFWFSAQGPRSEGPRRGGLVFGKLHGGARDDALRRFHASLPERLQSSHASRRPIRAAMPTYVPLSLTEDYCSSWGVWEGWHDDAKNSSGWIKPPPSSHCSKHMKLAASKGKILASSWVASTSV